MNPAPLATFDSQDGQAVLVDGVFGNAELDLGPVIECRRKGASGFRVGRTRAGFESSCDPGLEGPKLGPFQLELREAAFDILSGCKIELSMHDCWVSRIRGG